MAVCKPCRCKNDIKSWILPGGLFFPGVDQQQPLRQAMCVHPGWDAPKSYFCLTRAAAVGNHARDRHQKCRLHSASLIVRQMAAHIRIDRIAFGAQARLTGGDGTLA